MIDYERSHIGYATPFPVRAAGLPARRHGFHRRPEDQMPRRAAPRTLRVDFTQPIQPLSEQGV